MPINALSLSHNVKISGTGVGTVGLSLLINLFIKTFDWDKTCLILSGIVLIGFTTCGILFKPLNASSPLVDITELSDKCAYFFVRYNCAGP